MKRFRHVTVQGGKEHVSTVVSGESEVADSLSAEAYLHLRSGWEVIVGERSFTARKDGVERTVFYREYDPMEDYASS